MCNKSKQNQKHTYDNHKLIETRNVHVKINRKHCHQTLFTL